LKCQSISARLHVGATSQKTAILKKKERKKEKSKVKQSLYTPWRRLGGEEV
jgi:hypothetical protein